MSANYIFRMDKNVNLATFLFIFSFYKMDRVKKSNGLNEAQEASRFLWSWYWAGILQKIPDSSDVSFRPSWVWTASLPSSADNMHHVPVNFYETGLQPLMFKLCKHSSVSRRLGLAADLWALCHGIWSFDMLESSRILKWIFNL